MTGKLALNWVGNPNPVVRMAMIVHHYKQAIDWKPDSLEAAEKVWKKLWEGAVKCDDAPPSEVVKAVEDDDLNTPTAIMHMMTFAQRKEGKKLYASMRYLGLLPPTP